MATRRRVVEVTRKKPAPEVRAIRARVLRDEDPDASYLDDPENADRRAEFERGDFAFVGVRAEAEVVVEGVSQTLTSGGLWGIESDSGEEYVREVAAEEYGDLRKILTSIGVPTAQLPTKFDPEWVEWEA
jgi:hypothetical protein